MSQIAAHRRSYRIRLREALRIHRVVAREEAGIAEVYRHLDHVGQGSAIGGQDCRDVVDGLLRLPLDVVANEFSGHRIDWPRPSHKDEISGSPSLGVSALWWRAAIALNYMLAHVFALSAESAQHAITCRTRQSVRRNAPRVGVAENNS